MGIMDMDSVPPETMISAPPLMMRSAAIAMACSPDEQKRLIVSAETSTGNPARSDAIRATFMPCSASGMAQPRMTSSISWASICGTRSSAPLIATAASSSGRVARSVPLKARPTGVRTEEAMTTSRIRNSYSHFRLPVDDFRLNDCCRSARPANLLAHLTAAPAERSLAPGSKLQRNQGGFMKRKAMWTAVVLVLLATMAAGQAQRQYLDVYTVQVKQDKRADFDAITKKIVAANHQNQGDSWLTMETVYGPGNRVTFISTRQGYGDAEK